MARIKRAGRAVAVLLLCSGLIGLCRAADAGASSSSSPITQESLGQALQKFFSVVGNPYDMRGLISLPSDRLAMAGVAPGAIQDYLSKTGLRGALKRTAASSAAATNSTADITDQPLVGAAQEVLARVQQRAQAAAATLDDAVSQAQERYGLPAHTGFSELGKSLVAWMKNAAQQAAANTSGQAAPTQQAASGKKLLSEEEGGQEVQEGQEEGEAAAAMASIRESLSSISDSTRRALLQTAAAVESEGRPLTARQRQLLQVQGFEPGTDPSGPLGLDSYARAYVVLFTNILDFFVDTAGNGVPTGLYFLLDLINAGYGTLEYYNWIRDLANALDAPFDNLINTNYFPLPQSNDDAEALLQRFLGQFCTPEEAVASQQVLGSFTGPTLTYTLAPASCPVLQDDNTGRQYVAFENCSSAELDIQTTPLVITEPYISAASYTGAQCAYTEVFGVDTATTLGGGTQTFDFRRSSRGVDIVPTITQINLVRRFRQITPSPPPPPPALDFGITAATGLGATVGLLVSPAPAAGK